jgi:hypothetical protein
MLLAALCNMPYCLSKPGEPVTSEPHAFRRKQPLPRLPCPNRCRVLVQSPAFFLVCQARKFFP